MKCFIFDFNLDNEVITSNYDVLDYVVSIGGNKIHFKYSLKAEDWMKDGELVPKDVTILNVEDYIEYFIKKYKHIIAGLILNKRIPKNFIFTKKNVLSLLEETDFPKTQEEKLNNLFIKSFQNQEYDGQLIENTKASSQFDAYKFYFRNLLELGYYFKVFESKGLITNTQFLQIGTCVRYKFTYEAYNYYNRILNAGSTSKNCFIAMSFDMDDRYIFSEGILPALKETGFQHLIVSDEHAEAEQTINDLIISKIKQSRFVIADFTKHKPGVYFEAGYGLGRGLKVIYTCEKSHFEKTHFDTNHYQYIVWETTAELKEKLVNKINAWIKD